MARMAQAMGVVVGLVVSLFLVAAADARSLADTLESAYNNNADIRERRQRLKAVDEELALARAGWLPTLEASTTVGAANTRSTAPFYESRNIEKKEYFQRELKLTQPLWRGGGTFASVRGAKRRIIAGRSELRAVEQNALLAAAVAHLDLAKQTEILNFARYNSRVLENHKRASEDRFAVGEVTRTDVAQAEARLAAAKAEEVEAEGQLRAAQANYLEIVGESAQVVENPSTNALQEMFADNFPRSIDDTEQRMLSNNPELVALADYERAARDQVDVESSSFLPQLSLEASQARSVNTQFEGGTSDDSRVAINLKVPIYRGGETSARVRRSKQEASLAVTNREQARRRLLRQATEDWTALKSSEAAMRFYRIQILANKAALAGVQAEANTGVRTVLELLDAQKELFSSRINLVEAKRNHLASGFNLMATIGGFGAEDLALDVAIYRPELYTDEEVDWRLWGTDIGKDEGGENKGGETVIKE